MLQMALFVPTLFAQTEQVVETSEELAPVAETSGSAVLDIILLVLIGAAALAVIGHMIYECFIRKSLRTDYSVDEFEAVRVAEGLDTEMTEEEMNVCERLNEYQNIWEQIPSEGEPSYLPIKKKQIDKVQALINDAIATKPTDQSVVDVINELNGVINDMWKRSFNGSKTMIVISVLVAAALSFIVEMATPAIMIGTGIVLYLFASRTPMFVLIRKELKGRGGRRSFLTLIMGGLFGAVAAAPTYKTITTYSDGHEETETDNSQTWFTLIIAFIVSVLLAIFLWAIALINYIRNYWLYF